LHCYAKTATDLKNGFDVRAIGLVLVILFSIYGYRYGRKSGDTDISVTLIIIGCFVGVTLLPGICHLIGVMRHNHEKLLDAVGKGKTVAK